MNTKDFLVLLSGVYGAWYAVPEDLALLFKDKQKAIMSTIAGSENWREAAFEFSEIFDEYLIDSPEGMIVTGDYLNSCK